MRDVLDRIPEPPESPGFFDRLWQRAEQADRRAARRWRWTAIGVAAVALTAAGVGAVAATRGTTSVVDTTVSCSLQDQGGVPGFTIGATPNTRYPSGTPIPAGFGVSTGANPSTLLLGVDRRFKGYRLDEQDCHRAPKIRLDANGLPKTPTVYRGGQYRSFALECTVGRLVFRARLRTGPDGLVSSAQLAVRATKREKPIAYVDWTPTKVVAYAVPPSGCSAY